MQSYHIFTMRQGSKWKSIALPNGIEASDQVCIALIVFQTIPRRDSSKALLYSLKGSRCLTSRHGWRYFSHLIWAYFPISMELARSGLNMSSTDWSQHHFRQQQGQNTPWPSTTGHLRLLGARYECPWGIEVRCNWSALVVMVSFIMVRSIRDCTTRRPTEALPWVVIPIPTISSIIHVSSMPNIKTWVEICFSLDLGKAFPQNGFLGRASVRSWIWAP